MIKIARRTFCLSAATATAAYLIGCGERKTELKVPENAEECVEMFRRFTEPAFGLEDAKAVLKLIGEPSVYESFNRKVFSYTKQSELVSTVQLTISDTRTGSQPSNDLLLTDMTINYERPIEISLNRLEHYLGTSRKLDTIMVGALKAPSIKAFTNISPGTSPGIVRGVGQSPAYEFEPAKPLADGSLKGRLKIECDLTTNNIKRVDSLTYVRTL